MTCLRCRRAMIIDEWGWIWICPVCGYVGPKATNKEIKELEDDKT
uniref:Uncharacterized protein n=1 Tax=viral metagenome TaxID=1070528 RepID=A0A6M3LPP9_9ZZZZ